MGGLTIETTLDPAMQPFLHDHQIEGKPVLPGVMGIEAFAEAALCMLPGWHVEAIEDVNFLAPFKFYRERAAHGDHRSGIPAGRRGGGGGLPLERQPRAAESDRAASDHALHGARAADQTGARSAWRRPAPGEPDGAMVEAARHLPRLLPRSGLPGSGAGVAGRSRGRWASSPKGLPDHHQPIRAVRWRWRRG